jgi:hypothetical protein
MQTRLKTLFNIGMVVFVFLISVGGILTIRAINGYPLIISDTSYKTLSLGGDNFASSNYLAFLNLLVDRFGGMSILLFQISEILLIFILIYFILEKLNLKNRIKILVFIFLSINPVLIWSALTINIPIFIFMLFCFATLMFLYRWYLGLLFSLLLLPFDLFSFVTILMLFSVYKNKKILYASLSIVLMLLFVLKPLILHNFVFEFGVLNGYSFAFFLIAFIGLFSKEIKNKGYYILLLLLFTKDVLSGYEILLTIPLIIFSVSAIEIFYHHKWSNRLLKVSCIILLFFALFFPFTVALQKLAVNQPDYNSYNSLMDLKNIPQGKILSLRDFGFTINYLTNKSVVWNSGTINNTIINMTQNVFTARSIKNVKPLLKDLNVNYLWITPKIKSEFKDRLIFLLRDNQTFQMVSKNKDYEIWKVLV